MAISAFHLHRRVQFYETDTAGVVHFSWYFRYMEEAEHAMWREVGLSIHAPESELVWPRVSANCDYLRPLRFEQEFDIRIRIVEIGARTMRYACELTDGTTTFATGSLTIACVKHLPDGRLKAVEIPAEVLQRFAVAEGASA